VHREIDPLHRGAEQRPRTEGQISYRCMKNATIPAIPISRPPPTDAAVKTLQSREFLRHTRRRPARSAGATSPFTPVELIAETAA